jgi:hypothetical protein
MYRPCNLAALNRFIEVKERAGQHDHTTLCHVVSGDEPAKQPTLPEVQC